MQDLPENTDLLESVADFLRQRLGTELEGDLAFQARVAANVVDLVRRDLAQPQERATEEQRRLEALLQASGNRRELSWQLCDRIAAGEMGLDTPGLTACLWFITGNKLVVDQPRYAGYVRAREQRSPRPGSE